MTENVEALKAKALGAIDRGALGLVTDTEWGELVAELAAALAERTTTAPAEYDGPHSRACGIVSHDHGFGCHSNCPTCHGSALSAPVSSRAHTEKTIREFHGDDVWRDDEGVIWMRLSEATESIERASRTTTAPADLLDIVATDQTEALRSGVENVYGPGALDRLMAIHGHGPVSAAPVSSREQVEGTVRELVKAHVLRFESDGDYCERTWLECSCEDTLPDEIELTIVTETDWLVHFATQLLAALPPAAPKVTAEQMARTIWDAAESFSEREPYPYEYLLERVANGEGDYAEIHKMLLAEATAVLALLQQGGE